LWLVLRQGISEPPTPGRPVDPKTYKKEYKELMEKTGKPFWPDAAWRDVVFAVAMIVVMAILALAFGPPVLGKPPDPSIVAANPRPDWYLLWYFAVLALLPHGSENYFMVFGPLLAGLILIVMPFVFNRGERSARRRPWSVAAVVMAVIMIGTLWVAGAKSNWSPNFAAEPLPPAVIGVQSGPIFDGARVFYEKGCLNCHLIGHRGGRRGPDLTAIGSLLSKDQIILRISNGGINMPAYATSLTPKALADLAAFLQSRKVPERD
jgi:ubiquinol-cytochrome c reductase cytochrome b subunit